MKVRSPIVGFIVAALLAGCVHDVPTQAIVAPAALPIGQAEPRGFLEVFSAYDPIPPSAVEWDREVRIHSDYAIESADPATARTIRNRAGAFGEDPRSVSLPPGAYRIKARASGTGLVVIPVVIAAGQRTIVHLENTSPPDAAFAFAADQVLLPDGRQVGWRIQAP